MFIHNDEDFNDYNKMVEYKFAMYLLAGLYTLFLLYNFNKIEYNMFE